VPSSRESRVKFPEKPPKQSRDTVISNPLEPTTTGALLLQSLLRLHAPHNALVLDRCAQGQRPGAVQLGLYPRSIESLPPQQLLALIPPLRASSTPSLTAQQFRLDRGVLCSVPWKHSSRTLSTIPSVLESARAAGPRRTRISKYVADFRFGCVGGPND
jgi:hypothetical protein